MRIMPQIELTEMNSSVQESVEANSKPPTCLAYLGDRMRNCNFLFKVTSFFRRFWQNSNRFAIALMASRAKQFQVLLSYIQIMLGLGLLSNTFICIVLDEWCDHDEETGYLDHLSNFCFGFGLCSMSNMITWEWIFAGTSTSWKIFLNSGVIGGFGSYLTWLLLTYVKNKYAADFCSAEETFEQCLYLFLGLDMGLASVIFLYASYTITNQSADILIICLTMILIFFISFIFGYGVHFASYNVLNSFTNNFWASIIVRTLSVFLRKVARWIINKLVYRGFERIGKSVKRNRFKIQIRMVVKCVYFLSPSNETVNAPTSSSSSGPANNVSQQPTGSISVNMPPVSQGGNVPSTSNSASASSSNEPISQTPTSESQTKIESVVFFYVPIEKSSKKMKEEGNTSEIKARFDIDREIRLSPTLIIDQSSIQSMSAKLEYRLVETYNDTQSPWLPFIYDPRLSTAFEFPQSFLNMHGGREFDIPVKPEDDTTLRFRYMAPFEIKVPCLLAIVRAPAKPSGGSIYVQFSR